LNQLLINNAGLSGGEEEALLPEFREVVSSLDLSFLVKLGPAFQWLSTNFVDPKKDVISYS